MITPPRREAVAGLPSSRRWDRYALGSRSCFELGNRQAVRRHGALPCGDGCGDLVRGAARCEALGRMVRSRVPGRHEFSDRRTVVAQSDCTVNVRGAGLDLHHSLARVFVDRQASLHLSMAALQLWDVDAPGLHRRRAGRPSPDPPRGLRKTWLVP